MAPAATAAVVAVAVASAPSAVTVPNVARSRQAAIVPNVAKRPSVVIARIVHRADRAKSVASAMMRVRPTGPNASAVNAVAARRRI